MGFQFNQLVGKPQARLAVEAGAQKGRERQEELNLERNKQSMTMRQLMLEQQKLKADTDISMRDLALRERESSIAAELNELQKVKMSLDIANYETPAQKRTAESDIRTAEALKGIDVYGKKKEIDVASDVRREMGLDATDRSQAEIARIRAETTRTDVDTYLKSLEAVYAPEILEAKSREAQIRLSNLEYESSEARRKIEDELLGAKLDETLLQNSKLREEMYFSGDIREADLETKREMLRQLKKKGALSAIDETALELSLYRAKKEEDLRYEINKTSEIARLSASGSIVSEDAKRRKEIELLQKKIDSYGKLSQSEKIKTYSKILSTRGEAEYYLSSRKKEDRVYGESLMANANALASYLAQVVRSEEAAASGAGKDASISIAKYSDEELERGFELAKESGRTDIQGIIIAEAKRRVK